AGLAKVGEAGPSERVGLPPHPAHQPVCAARRLSAFASRSQRLPCPRAIRRRKAKLVPPFPPSSCVLSKHSAQGKNSVPNAPLDRREGCFQCLGDLRVSHSGKKCESEHLPLGIGELGQGSTNFFSVILLQ